jgi:curli biogenesis system outer membrane secretion channel CsgG
MRQFSVIILSFLLSVVCPAQEKKRIAVLNFDYAAVRTSAAGILGGEADIGKAISDLLVAQLLADGKFALIERQALDRILTEQNFSNSDRTDSATAAKLGRVLGVDALVVGTVTQFGIDDKISNVGGSALTSIGMMNSKAGAALNNITSRFAGASVQKKDDRALVGITARLIDASTGQILVAVTGRGESRRSGTSLVGGFTGGAAYGTNSVNATAALVGDATRQSVISLAQQLEQISIPVNTVAKLRVEGLIADVAGNTVVLNIGRASGVQPGEKLDVLRNVRTVRDPQTQKVIRTIEDRIGEATLTEIDDSSSLATLSPGVVPKVGDRVRAR